MQIKQIMSSLMMVVSLVIPQIALESTLPGHIVRIEPRPDPLDSVIKHLSWCESRDNEYAVNWNDGGSPSYGRFQFKKATWHYYIDRFDLFPEVEYQERMNLIYDGQAQEIVARRVLEEGGWENWYNCLNGLYGAK